MSTKSKKRSRAPASAGTFLQNWLNKSQCNDGANGGAENLNDDGHLTAATSTAATAATMPATGAANGDEDASQSDGSAPKPRPAKLSRSAITQHEIDDLAFSEDEDSSDDDLVDCCIFASYLPPDRPLLTSKFRFVGYICAW